MPASEAQIRANQAEQPQESSGPKTAEGKERSRGQRAQARPDRRGASSCPSEDAAEVERMFAAFEADLRPVRRAGPAARPPGRHLLVRMERGRRSRRPPRSPSGSGRGRWPRPRRNGEDPDSRPARRAMFDPSKEATLARQVRGGGRTGLLPRPEGIPRARDARRRAPR